VTFTPTDSMNYTSVTATVPLTVNSLPVSVTVTPPSATLYSGQTQQFNASVSNTSNTSVVWVIIPAGVGTIASTGLYTAPATISTQQTVSVTATSIADYTKSASATVTLSLAQCGSNGYSFQRAITIDHTKVPNTDQSNFPFLFNTTDPLLATTANGGHVTNPNGYDIIFTSDPAGQNILNYEMEEYDPVHGQVIAWVRIPTLSHTADTVIYVFYGNSSITTSQQNPTGVWDSNYMGVWHLANGTTISADDSTINGNNGRVVGATATTGKIDGGLNNPSSTSGYIDLSSTALATATPSTFSLEAWVNLSGVGGWPAIVDFDANNSNNWGLYVEGGSGIGVVVGNNMPFLIPSANIQAGWNHIVATRDGQGLAMYLNGVETGTTWNDSNYGNGTASATIGLGYGGELFNGLIDEVRVSTGIARSADWIATEYNNQSLPSAFYALYPENAIAVIPNTANLYAGRSQQFTATGACGTTMVWSILSGAPGTLGASGLYTAPSSIASQQTVAITASSQKNGEFTGTSIVTLLPAPLSPTLTLAAATQPPYVTGTSQTFTATLKNGSGTPISGESVTFTVSGANSNAGSGTTDSNGNASYTYTGASSGTDTIQATTIVGGEQVTSNKVMAIWIVSVQAISATTVKGEFFLSDGCGCFDTPRNATPVFVQEFPVINFIPPAGNASGVNTNTRPFTDVITDINGNFTGTIIAQGNCYQAGVGPMNDFQAVFFGSFTVASAGNVVFSFYHYCPV
jgi:hypothetical protein